MALGDPPRALWDPEAFFRPFEEEMATLMGINVVAFTSNSTNPEIPGAFPVEEIPTPLLEAELIRRRA